ncbi:MAG: aldose 1-epimerase family protein [Bacteroides sp.]|nr:aldose 1-epimerase family protein [Bacteroides sp.]
MKTLKNTALTLNISLHGAELTSIRDSFGREFLWQADPAFWKRHSPVLFPIVGSLWDKHFRVNGREYEMGQHGFARDMDFRLVSEREDEMWFELKSSPETLAKYPYKFTLRIGYRLEANKIHVMWEVSGDDSQTMWFQIGAHPAFYLPRFVYGGSAACASDSSRHSDPESGAPNLAASSAASSCTSGSEVLVLKSSSQGSGCVFSDGSASGSGAAGSGADSDSGFSVSGLDAGSCDSGLDSAIGSASGSGAAGSGADSDFGFSVSGLDAGYYDSGLDSAIGSASGSGSAGSGADSDFGRAGRGCFRLYGRGAEGVVPLESFRYIKVSEKQCTDISDVQELDTPGGVMPLDDHTFDIGAYIIGDSQVCRVDLVSTTGLRCVSLEFDTPLVGLWAPSAKDVPFVCIEPWYGRCDRVGFTGEFSERDCVNSLSPGQVFRASYTITVG